MSDGTARAKSAGWSVVNVQSFPETIQLVCWVYVVPLLLDRYTMSVCPLSDGSTLRLIVATCQEKNNSLLAFPTWYAVPTNAYPESERFPILVLISGAWSIVSHPPPEAVIVSPLYGKKREDPLELTLIMVIVPLLLNVTPVEVHPLNEMAPRAMIAHDESLPTTWGV